MGYYIYHQCISSHKSTVPMAIFFNITNFIKLEEILRVIYSDKKSSL